jgi:Na+-translocating ferredoxin:NAD+ oxidoreductase RnfC subunit
MGIHPEFAGEYEPKAVRIPLQQHIGAPAVSCVEPGRKVAKGDPVGLIPEGKLGAMVHASISGVVREVDNSITIEGV